MTLLAIVHIIALLALVVSTLVLGYAMAARPSQRRYEMLRPLTWGTVLASSSAVLSGLSNVALRLAETATSPSSAEVVRRAWAGVAEALVPGIFGLGLLAVAWGLAAVGLRRLD